MKELHGSSSALVATPVEDCAALLEAVDRYPNWYPDVVTEVDVVERDDEGRATKAQTTLHVEVGPLVRDFHLLLAVRVERPRLVQLTRIRHGDADQEAFEVTWRLEDRGGGTRIELELDANLSVPRLLPLGGIGATMAQGFVTAAARALG